MKIGTKVPLPNIFLYFLWYLHPILSNQLTINSSIKHLLGIPQDIYNKVSYRIPVV